MKGSRIHELDLLRTIGIFLVVLGHTPVPDLLRQLIYSFHMPLFFFMSGFLQPSVLKSERKAFMLKKVHRIVLPYFYFNIITYIFWFFIGRKFGVEVDSPVSPIKPIIGMFYGIGNDHYLIHCGHLWFLPTLFVVILLYNITIDSTKTTLYKLLVVTVLSGLGYLASEYIEYRIPWGFKMALVASVFYFFGNFIREKRDFIQSLNKRLLILGCCVLMLATYYLSVVNGEVSMSFEVYHNYLLYILNAFSGIMAFYLLSLLLQTQNKIVVYTSVNSMHFYVFHQISLSVIKFVYAFALSIPLTFLENKVLLNILNAVVVFILLVPLVYIINKYFPWIVGGHRAKKKY